MTESTSIFQLISQASPMVMAIMLLLLLASFYGWCLIAVLEVRFWRANSQDKAFENMFWSGVDVKTLYQRLQASPLRFGLSAIFFDGFSEFLKLRQKGLSREQIISGTERMIRIAMNRQQHLLEKGSAVLATIGSVAPYVGLLGTVWGIMSAFLGLAQVEQATLASVAPGIAEALIATAMGLFAAIPAVVAYNRYTTRGEEVYEQRMLFAEELTAMLQREAK